MFNISTKTLGNASPHGHFGMSCVTVSRFKLPFVPCTVVGSKERFLIIRTLPVTTTPRRATPTSPNPATAFFLKTRHMFFLTSSASVFHICGRCFCIVLWFPYSSAFLKSACDCLVSRGHSVLYYSEDLDYLRKMFTSPKYRLTSLMFNGGDTRVPPIPLATSLILPPFSPAS